ncbi:MAG: DUF547 domain-containing protein [Bacteroidota bacterium]
MKTITLFALISLLALHPGSAQETADFFSRADAFFSAYIKDGRVDYAALKADPTQLDELLALSKTLAVAKEDAPTYQAFWINGYNLLVIKGIVDHYPVKSPLDIKGFFDTTKRDFGGKQITLNDIENQLLRGNFPGEARFHFVLVCAGIGCPPIIGAAYLPSTLGSQLQRQTELALNNPNFIKVKGKKVQISQIFEWYKEDFTQGGQNEVDFINGFRKEKISAGAKVSYYPYDWALNEIQ